MDGRKMASMWRGSSVPLMRVSHKCHLMWVVEGMKGRAMLVNDIYALRAYGVGWFAQLALWFRAYDKAGSFLLLCDCGGYNGWVHHALRLGVRDFFIESRADSMRSFIESYGGAVFSVEGVGRRYHFRDGFDDSVREDFVAWLRREGLAVS
ncbi:MAG: hypothetical protein GDA54_05970 [Alphaproteobacteria bacterium GM7ARS4]|nr:hypothetical protein [Alphaproteobacteria bacterium GM7ARS4]